MTETIVDKSFEPATVLDTARLEVGTIRPNQCYQLTVLCGTPAHFGKGLFVLVNGQKRGFARVPMIAGRETVEFAIRFRCDDNGVAQPVVCLQAENIPDTLGSSDIIIRHVRLQEFQPSALMSWPVKPLDNPESPLLGVWGYRIAGYYQKAEPGVGPEKLYDEAVYYRRLGANIFSHCIYKKAKLDTPVQGIVNGMKYPLPWAELGLETVHGGHIDPRWSKQAFGDLVRKINALGAPVSLAAVFSPADLADRPKKLQFLQLLLNYLSDSLALEEEELYTALETELYFRKDEDLRDMTDMFERNCPGGCLMDYHLRPDNQPPSFVLTAQSAHGYGKIRSFGMDDHDPIRAELADGTQIYNSPLYGMFTDLPALSLCNSNGTQHIACELDMRDSVAPGDTFGGGCFDDWIIKQVNDLVRPDLEHNTRHFITPFLYASPERTSPERFLMGAAVSADPLRAALAAQLLSTGAGGAFEQKRRQLQMDMDPFAEPATVSRVDLPAETWFLQNNYLRLYAGSSLTHAQLWSDPQVSAHWDDDSLAQKICPELFEIPAQWRWKRTELGPVVARLEAVDFQDNVVAALEMHPDSPYFFLQFPGDRDFHFGPHTQIQFQYHNNIAVISRQKPDPSLFMFVLDDSAARLEQGHPTGQITVKAKKTSWTAVLGLIEPLHGRDLARLREALRNPDQLSDTPCPVVRAVSLARPPLGPVWVQQNHWWLARAAQMSFRDNSKSWLKVYSYPDQPTHFVDSTLLSGLLGPGPGCDYLLAFRDLKSHRLIIECEVAVLGANPMISTPRIRVHDHIAAVELDGQPWQRFHKKSLWLTTVPGRYHLKITLGSQDIPRVGRSSADFSQCCWMEQTSTLQLDVKKPSWCKAVPPWYYFTALIEHEGWSITQADGAEVLRGNSRKSIVKLSEDLVRIAFRRIENNSKEG